MLIFEMRSARHRQHTRPVSVIPGEWDASGTREARLATGPILRCHKNTRTAQHPTAKDIAAGFPPPLGNEMTDDNILQYRKKHLLRVRISELFNLNLFAVIRHDAVCLTYGTAGSRHVTHVRRSSPRRRGKCSGFRRCHPHILS